MRKVLFYKRVSRRFSRWIWLLFQIQRTPLQASVIAMITIKVQLFLFYQLACEDTKLRKMLFKESIDSAIRKFKSTVTTLKHHIYIKRIQFNYYNNIKNNLGKSDLLVHDEYSQSYENKQQHGIQSTYFGHTTLAYSLHAVTFKILKIILLANLSPSPVNFLTIQEPLQLPPSQRLLRM